MMSRMLVAEACLVCVCVVEVGGGGGCMVRYVKEVYGCMCYWDYCGGCVGRVG
jgi:hypothetical protein